MTTHSVFLICLIAHPIAHPHLWVSERKQIKGVYECVILICAETHTHIHINSVCSIKAAHTGELFLWLGCKPVTCREVNGTWTEDMETLDVVSGRITLCVSVCV